MECEEIKKIIPKYFQHTASAEEIQVVEEHLCVCHDCRTVLGELMDKASEAEEAAEAHSQEQAEPLPKEKAKPPLEEEKEEPPKEKAEEKKEEEVPAPGAKEIEEKRPEESPEERGLPKKGRSEGEEDLEYFPGEDLEASMDKVDDILGKTEPAKGDSGDKPKEVEPIAQDKEEEKAEETTEEKEEVSEPILEEKEDEDSSFEIISDSPVISKQELPAESDIETLGIKDLEPVAEDAKEPEEKTELPPEEEKAEETTEEKEEVSEPSSETGIELKEEEPEEPAPKEEGAVSLEEGGESQESLEEVSHSLDGMPLEKSNAGLLEYLCLVAGLGVLGFLTYLLLKG